MMLRPHEFAEACDCGIMRAGNWVEPMNVAMMRWDIDTPVRIAAFLAQVSHESGCFQFVREIWGPTATQLRYEGRVDLGNTEKGDGYRYLGRGPIQLTGRANYRKFRDECSQRVAGVRDFEAEPERVEAPRWGAHAAGWFWHSKGLNVFADSGDFESLTKRINGGTNGLAHRLELWAKAKHALNVKD